MLMLMLMSDKKGLGKGRAPRIYCFKDSGEMWLKNRPVEAKLQFGDAEHEEQRVPGKGGVVGRRLPWRCLTGIASISFCLARMGQ